MIRQVAELCGTLTALQGRYPIEVSGEPCLVLAIFVSIPFYTPSTAFSGAERIQGLSLRDRFWFPFS